MKIKETECKDIIKTETIANANATTTSTILQSQQQQLPIVTTTTITTLLTTTIQQTTTATSLPADAAIEEIKRAKALENLLNIPQQVLHLNNNVNGLSTTATTTTKTTTTAREEEASATALSSSSLSSATKTTAFATTTAAKTKTTTSNKAFKTTPLSEKSTKPTMATATATVSNAANHLTTSTTTTDNISKNDIGVLDFTINSTTATAVVAAAAAAAAASASSVVSSANTPATTISSSLTSSASISTLTQATATATNLTTNQNNNTLKVPKTNNCFSNCSNDINRTPSATAAATATASISTNNHNGSSCYGGRLQFFKDGKFILELARSKDNEKGGWVSVPRKLFRTPAAATSATVTPTSAAVVAYPKNENSTSLSFSDDNSSIQSSPWQRDHSWKQATPRRNISKEMALFYHCPKQVALSKHGLQLAKRKSRNPYDKSIPKERIFQPEPPPLQQEKIKEEFSSLKNDTKKAETNAEQQETKIKDCSEDNLPLKNEEKQEENVCLSHSSEMKEVKEEKVLKDDVVIKKEHVSNDETDVAMETSEFIKEEQDHLLNGEVKEEFEANPNESESLINKKDSKGVKSINEIVSKRTKTRAKLNTIIQKLIDDMPARVAHLSKTSVTNGGSATNNCSSGNSSTHKVSPPSSASRLVEYHQQHVSPRKRILREFEKVSLEDNPSGGAGGKRSRAKASLSSAPTTTQFQNSRSPTNRTNLSSPSNATNLSTNGTNTKTTTKANNTSTAPTRLYSSYSIHSLLSNSSSSSAAGGSSSSSNSKKTNEQNSTNSHHHINHMNHQYNDPKSYQNAVLVSPKSPENSNHNNSYSIGGKSPSQSTFKKRSPPYASPMHDGHSRSPIIAQNNQNNDYLNTHSPRSSPAHLHPAANRKILYANDSANGSNPPSQSPSSHHLMPQSANQNYYSPYMMSSPTSAPSSSSISPSNGNINLSRSPRHASAFAPTSNHSNIPNNNNSSSSSLSVNLMTSRDLSPPRPSNEGNREVTTPRTVPKKTASIRRQFASPTTSTTSSCPSPNEKINEESLPSSNTYHHDRKTPVSSIQNQQHLLQRSSPNNATSHSNSSGGVSSPHNYYMYPHASPLNGSTNPLHHLSNSSSSAAAVAAAAAAAYNIPSMMPPSGYYSPYLMSTLAAMRQNPMWLHQYQGAGMPLTAAAASSRLSSPFHGFPYNGVNPAYVAAAAAAIAGQPSLQNPSSVPLSHLQQVQAHAHAQAQAQAQAHAQAQAQHLMGSINTTGAYHHPNSMSTHSRHTEHLTKTTDSIENSTTKNSNQLSSGGTRLHHHQHHHNQPQPTNLSSSLSLQSPSILSSSSTRYPVDTNSIKEHEQSSDVPLNLSKH